MRAWLELASLLLIMTVNAVEADNIGRRPNIILILTDDQDIELGSMHFMPRTMRLIRDEGVEMTRAYATTPMCCPSRSTLFTGRYGHNHGVLTNGRECGGKRWQREQEPYTFGVYLSEAGYRTGYFGKYLNQYDGSYIPPGWREWNALVGNSVYYNYSMNVNGKLIPHGFDYRDDYITDLIANESIAFLKRSKNKFAEQPFMIFLSFAAPHGPQDAAPQFSRAFFNVTTHRTPAYDHAPNPDKQWILRQMSKLSTTHKKFTDLLVTKRLQTLQSVDVAVERIYDALDDLGELDNTYIIYTSDHGYHSGQFGMVVGKGYAFEFDIRVPFFARGPGIQPGSSVGDIILNMDLGPTFLDIAGLEIPKRMDGKSLKALLTTENVRQPYLKWRDTFLIESPIFDKETSTEERSVKTPFESECLKPGLICFVQDNDHWRTPPYWTNGPLCCCTASRNNSFACIRTINETHNFLYCQHDSGFRDYYDLTVDPFQLMNRIFTLTSVEERYMRAQLNHLRNCKSTSDCTFGIEDKNAEEKN